jgi:hypothetical protein
MIITWTPPPRGFGISRASRAVARRFRFFVVFVVQDEERISYIQRSLTPPRLRRRAHTWRPPWHAWTYGASARSQCVR